MSWIYGITLPFPGIGEDSNFSMTKSLVCSSLSLLLCRNLQSPTFARFFSQIIGGTISNPIDAVQKTERGSDNDIAGNHDQVATLTTFRQSQSNSSETFSVRWFQQFNMQRISISLNSSLKHIPAHEDVVGGGDPKLCNPLH